MNRHISLWVAAVDDRPAIEVASAEQLPLLWIAALNARDLPSADAPAPEAKLSLDTAAVCQRLRERAMYVDNLFGAGGVVWGYARLLIDALSATGRPQVDMEFEQAAALDLTLLQRLAVVVRGIEEQDTDVSFELPPVKQLSPFTLHEMMMPSRTLKGLRAVLQSIVPFDRHARVPSVHHFLTGQPLSAEALRGIEQLIGAPVGVNTPWRQVVQRRSSRR